MSEKPSNSKKIKSIQILADVKKKLFEQKTNVIIIKNW